MSQWNHAMCDDCWLIRNGDDEPYRLKVEYREELRCCWCGNKTKSGIFVREDPSTLAFHREHPE